MIITSGRTVHTVFEHGYGPAVDAPSDWLVLDKFDIDNPAAMAACRDLVHECRLRFGSRGCRMFKAWGGGGRQCVVIVPPDEPVVLELGDVLMRTGPSLSQRDYDRAVEPWVEKHWAELPLSRRIGMALEVQAPADCVMERLCPPELWDLVEASVHDP